MVDEQMLTTMNRAHTISQMDYLEIAGNMLERHDTYDSSAPNLLEATGFTQNFMATASGLYDYDYKSILSRPLEQKDLNQLLTVNKVPIPPEVLEHFKHIKCHCMMGLFPEIGRAWLTIDSDIYIWTYEQTRDVAYFDGLNHLIISVGLVPPKPGVFVSDVKYLLILTTPVEIVVLGVTFADTTKTISSPNKSMQNVTTYEEMQLMNKPIFILNTEGVSISTIESSTDGRIFLGGRDGNLYELFYQAESSWFGKRCKKINHSKGIMSNMIPSIFKIFSEVDPIEKIAIDNSRQLLYILTEKGSIEAWDMGEDYNTIRRISKISQNDMVNNAANILRTVDSSIFKPIKAICPLSEKDCHNVHLLAISESGVRFYFSVNLQQGYSHHQQQPEAIQTSGQSPQVVKSQQLYEAARPHNLYLMHIRLPPGYAQNNHESRPKHIHSAFYSGGSLLMVSTPQQQHDMLWSITSEPFRFRPWLVESTETLSLDGMVWGLAEAGIKNKTKSQLGNAHKQTKVVLLTNQGTHTVALLRPVDILQQLLVACHGPQHEAVKYYFQMQSEHEACATALLLACMDAYRGTDIAMWAAQAFVLYGGEPYIGGGYLVNQVGVGQRNIMPQSPDRNSPRVFMSTPYGGRAASSVQHNLMQQTQYPPSPISNQTFQQYPVDVNSVNYSAKHAGLYLHVLRLLRPIWKMRCVDVNMCSTITQADCTELLQNLYATKAFLEANSVNELAGSTRLSATGQNSLTNGFRHLTHNISINEQQQTSLEQAQTEENRSLIALNHFLKHVCEVLALWKILCEHQFSKLMTQLPMEQTQMLMNYTFRDLILVRVEICAHFIVALINSYLNDNASVSFISEKLRELCPNLYRHEDAVSHKATKILMDSKNCTSVEEKEEKLRTALELCKDAAPNLPLTTICQQFTLAGFYQGVIDLAARCAAKVDPKEAALHFYRNNEPIEDQEGNYAYTARNACYSEVEQMLDMVYQNILNANSNVEFGPHSPQSAAKNVSNEIMKIVSIAIQVSDPLLHVVVYEWLRAHNLLSELLSLTEPSLGEFFKRSIDKNPDDLQLADLHWKYYERNGQHSAAAKILDNLASKESISISLMLRIEYLARAVMCMRNDNSGYSTQNGVLLKDLEDKLDIARVQKMVLDSISSTEDSHNIKEKLNEKLYDMTELYLNFAEPYELWECKLTILNCVHHNDPILIQSVWTEILNKAVGVPGTAQQKYKSLISKVQSLVKEFGDSGHCFPLAFLVRELELKCCHLKPGQLTVPEALLEMNLDAELLIDTYARMMSMNERCWANEGNEWHLIQASSSLINRVIDNANQIPNRNKRRIVTKAQDLISSCLHLVYAKSSTDDLIRILKEIQIKLQRIL